MLLDVLNLLHNFSENLGAVLRRIPILDQANFDVKFKLVANILIVEPVCKRRFCINDFLRRWTKGYTIKQPNMDCQPTEITALMRHRAVFS